MSPPPDAPPPRRRDRGDEQSAWDGADDGGQSTRRVRACRCDRCDLASLLTKYAPGVITRTCRRWGAFAEERAA